MRKDLLAGGRVLFVRLRLENILRLTRFDVDQMVRIVKSKALFSLVAIVLSLWPAVACNRSAEAGGEAAAGKQALPVKVQVAELQRVGEFTDYLATLKSRSAAVLKPQVEGQVTRIFAHAGERVPAGAPLLQIDPLKQEAAVNNQEATVKSKQAAHELNRVELERRKKLFASGVISRAELDQAQTAYEASKSDVEALQASVHEQQVQLKYYTVRAPMAGVVGDIPVRVGDRVTNQSVLTTVDTAGELEAYISVPADRAGKARQGKPVEILAEGGEAAVRTSISFVSPRVDSESQTLLLKAPVPNRDHRLRNDQVVRARVFWGERQAPLIPMSAVTRLGGQFFAFVVEGQGKQAIARQKVIQVGEIVDNKYIVLDGIKPGERIITSGIQVLADGTTVAPQS